MNRDFWTRYKRMISSTFYNGRRYHIISQLLLPSNDKIYICRSCSKSLHKKEVPDICIASGFDLGDPAMAGISDPTMAETFCLSKARVLNQALALKSTFVNGSYSMLRGHTISFPVDAPHWLLINLFEFGQFPEFTSSQTVRQYRYDRTVLIPVWKKTLIVIPLPHVVPGIFGRFRACLAPAVFACPASNLASY